MRLPSLVSLPDIAKYADVTVTLSTAVGRTVSPFTYSEQSFLWGGEQWRIDFSVPPITSREEYSKWMAFGASLRGSYNYFLLGDPMATSPLGVGTGTPVVNAGGQTGNTLTTDGWTAGVSGILKAGDYFQLGSGTSSRLYMLTQDADSDSAGAATLNFVPALRSSPALNAPLVINSPKGLFRMDANSFSFSVTPAPFYSFAFSAVEVISA